jgi:hypothetical protein
LTRTHPVATGRNFNRRQHPQALHDLRRDITDFLKIEDTSSQMPAIDSWAEEEQTIAAARPTHRAWRTWLRPLREAMPESAAAKVKA